MLNAGLMEGRIGNIDYFLKKNGDSIYDVTYVKKDRGLGFIGNPLRLSKYKASFKLI